MAAQREKVERVEAGQEEIKEIRQKLNIIKNASRIDLYYEERDYMYSIICNYIYVYLNIEGDGK